MEKQSTSLRYRGGRYPRSFRGLSKRVSTITKSTVRSVSEVKYSVRQFYGSANIVSVNTCITEVTPLIPSGISKTTRIGNKITYKFLQVNLSCLMGGLWTGAQAHQMYQTLRVVLFQSKVPVDPALLSTLNISDISNISRQPFALTTFKPNHIRVLDDQMVPMTCCTVGNLAPGIIYNQAGVPSMVSFQFRHKLNNEVNILAGQSISTEPKDRFWLFVAASPMFPISINDEIVTVFFNCVSRMSFTDT